MANEGATQMDSNTVTTPAGDLICRSCGFQAHPDGDLIDGQCPRWAAGS